MNIKKEISEIENMQLVLDGKKPAWLPSFSDACAFAGHNFLGNARYGKAGGVKKDIFGVEFTQTIDGPIPLNTHTRNFELKDITKWREVMPDIDLNSIDWEEEARAIRETKVKEGQMINFNAGFVWEEMHYLMGYEEALASLLVEPEASFEFLNAVADFWIDALRRVYKYLKPEIVMFMEHTATEKGTLMSPDTYREIIKPVHKKMFDAITELGALPEMHCDGFVEDLIPDWVEIGVKAIQPFQAFNDINKFKEEYGLIAVGGWDAFGPGNQENTTEEEARESVRLAMDSFAPGYRYVFWESGVTPRYLQTKEYIQDEARIYGAQFYK